MLRYEDYKLPCWANGTFNAADNMLRTQFDYGIRQRRKPMGLPTASYAILIKDQKTFESFTKFWGDLNNGVDVWTTDNRFGPYKSKNKKVRFTQPYQMNDLGAGLFEITCTIEMADPKNDATVGCTLFPHDTLHPEDKLYPNKC